ncbi:DUF1850 domain-containing protein [Natronoglycomyces albus]|uniref:DUF1850 domain-containing protein n=1 Tax=Natronoglycomyces albus TaxID=2811108 RepID=A0A895XH81_9ACTN|nr:DUF1850 domain-containing protein [Natronoglycomyces albus]QSB04277.1 DUF1850 domain-containing protein [Natronoglycomyces albus]
MEILHGDDVLYSRVIEPGEEFTMTHVHSLTERTVRETFSVSEAGEILMEELWFDQHGANLPAGPEEYPDYTTTYEVRGGEVFVSHHSHPLPTFDIVVGGPDRARTLHFADGHSQPLLDIADFGTPVEVTTNLWKG